MDNTAFFKQCIDIYSESLQNQEEIESNLKINTKTNQTADYHIKNSEFYTKATSIHHALSSLMSLIISIRPQYLLANSKKLTEDQKILIDTEIKLKIQRLTTKVRNLQDVQASLENMSAESDELSNALSKIGFSLPIQNQSWNSIQNLTRNLISMGDYSDYISIRNETLRTIFSNIVKSLTLNLQNLLLTWNDMHDKRVERLLQLKKSALSTSSSSSLSPYTDTEPKSLEMNDNMFKLNDSSGNSTKNLRNLETKYVSDDYELLHDQLPKQELLQLQSEQDNLAEELKKGTIDEVTQIEESMMDVATMVREIGMQLSIQNENISLLDQHKDEIVGNVKSGNTVLIKANEANSKRNKTLAWSIFFAALILLMIDYIL